MHFEICLLSVILYQVSKHELKTQNIESRSLKRHIQIASVFFLDQDLKNVNLQPCQLMVWPTKLSLDHGFKKMFSDQRRNEECVTSLLHITINRYMNKRRNNLHNNR